MDDSKLKYDLARILQKIADSGYDLSEITGWTNEDDDGNEYPVTGLQCADDLFGQLTAGKSLSRLVQENDLLLPRS